MEAQILAFLLKRGATSKSTLEQVVYGICDHPSKKSLDVALWKLRRKMLIHDITISTEGHDAVMIQPGMKARIRAAISTGAGEEKP